MYGMVLPVSQTSPGREKVKGNNRGCVYMQLQIQIRVPSRTAMDFVHNDTAIAR
ncbi:hypothetical protein GYMLUDRAFT_829217 [Collybiopsis luxurians FD-317 M1]|uniref:Uncharacterized protein n=1 Tax=Collybiopsis luxurians FD-317 M1 TaxID=944289 RepID=A0A0D0CLJ9_9AGAR|nr:hypothetical protein GYMLUDRAFT_829217 [Collybiopsis luxurians FD-317 M1]